MAGQCRNSAEDDGPTLNQHRVDILPANTGHPPNAGPMLAHRPLCRPNTGTNTGRTSRARWTVIARTREFIRVKRVMYVSAYSTVRIQYFIKKSAVVDFKTFILCLSLLINKKTMTFYKTYT